MKPFWNWVNAWRWCFLGTAWIATVVAMLLHLGLMLIVSALIYYLIGIIGAVSTSPDGWNPRPLGRLFRLFLVVDII